MVPENNILAIGVPAFIQLIMGYRKALIIVQLILFGKITAGMINIAARVSP